MAGGKPTTELPVEIDADGKAIFAVFNQVTAKLKEIQGQVTAIGKTSGLSAEKFKQSLDVTVKQLRDQMGQMRTLAQGMNTPGVGLQTLNANKTLATQTRAATEYAQTLKMARDSAEALRAKINDLNKEVAARGRKDQGATIGQRDRLAMYEKQLAALKALDAQAAQNERRISKTKGGDLTAELKALTDAQARLQTAALNPRRSNLDREIKAAQLAQDQLTEAINRTRNAQASLVREQRAQRLDLAGRDVRTMTANGQSLTAVRSSLQDNRLAAEERLAGATGAQIGPAREALKLAEARVRAIDAMIRGTDKQTAAIQKRNDLEAREDRRRQGALANSEVRGLVAQKIPLGTIQSNMVTARDAAEARLAGAGSPAQVAAARETLAIAERRLRIIDQIIRGEEQAAKAAAAAAASQQRAADSRTRADTASQWRGSREYLVGEAKKVQDITRAEELRLSTQQRIASLRQQMLGADTATEKRLREQLLTEKQIEAQLTRNINEINKQTAAQRRLNEEAARQTAAGRAYGPHLPTAPAPPSGGGGILPAGGFPTVFARTAAYGAAGTLLFGLVSTLKQGAQFTVDFEDKLKTLQAIANATDLEMTGLTSAITSVGETSRYSLVDLTDMATKLAQAGVSASSMGESLSSVSKLATASGSTPAESVDLITAALGSFQLQANETPRIADLITSALNRTRLTVQQAALAIQYVGATAFEQNISLEQLLATTAALSQAGIRSGSTIGTGMRQFLVDLQSPSEKLTTALTDLGVSASDVDVRVRGLPAVLETLSKSGFGASQAYGALETRAAAFYLVAKNNTDIMAQLQMDFAETGAAAVAQERAMDSLTAQWQRFKNIVGESFADSAEGTLVGFKNLLKKISDNMTEARRIADQTQASRDAKLDQGLSGVDNLGSFDAYATDKLISGLRGLVNESGDGYKLGDVLFGVARGADAAGNSVERLTAQMNVQDGATSEVRDKMSSLDKEIARLILQEDSLASTSNGVAVETVNLSGRFEGLAAHIVTADGSVRGLIGAMQALRNEEGTLLLDRLGEQIDTTQSQIAKGRIARTGAVDKLRKNLPVYNLLTEKEKVAVASLDSGNATVASNARQILRDAQSDALANGLNDLAAALGPLTTIASGVATATGRQRILNTEVGNERFRQSEAGQRINGDFENATGIADQLRSASAEDRVTLMARLEKILTPLERILVRNIGTNPEKNPYQTTALETLRQIRQGALATVKPGKEAATPVGKTRMITAGDILRIAQEVSPGIRTDGSERRSRAWQNAAHAAGKTPADADHSFHTRNDGVAKDLPGSWGKQAGEALAASMNARAKAEGLKITYKWESGHGKNQGTGEHIHGQALKNQRVAFDGDARADAAERRQDISTDKLGLGVKTDKLQSSLRSLGDATTEEAFKAAALASETALNEWATQLKAVSEEELITTGALPNQIADRRREVDNQIAQKREEMVAQIKRKAEDFQKDQLKTILKSLDNMLDAAQLAFDQAMQPAADRITALQAQAEGLGFASNAGNVPDYVQALQDRRIAVAQEDQARERSARLPTLIDSNRASLFEAETKFAIMDKSLVPKEEQDAAKNKITELTAAIAALRVEKQNLDLALGAGGLVPTTLSEGLNQAIEAFQLATNSGQSFTDMLIQNMGGALTNVSDGLTEMFTNIMTGSMTVLEAFKGFVQGMIKYMIQLAARAVALKVFNLLLNAVGAGASGSLSTVSGGSAGGAAAPAAGAFGFNGAANIDGEWVPALMGGGGRVTKGSATRDSVKANIAKDEWVINSRATKSVGHDFMAKLNNQGAAALDAMRGSPIIVPQGKQEVNVFVVKEGEKPQLGKNDILLAVHEDIMSGGETKKLIHHVAQGG